MKIRAQFESECMACGRKIYQGQLIEYTPGCLGMHVSCQIPSKFTKQTRAPKATRNIHGTFNR